jgi:signal peptidase I
MINLSSIPLLKRFIVKGHSMEPLFKEGDRIVINTFAYLFSKPKLDDVVAFQTESQRGTILLKKIDRYLGDGEYFVVGVNRNDSRDSRYFGAIKEGQILGKYLATY